MKVTNSTFTKLITSKSSVCVASAGGRTLYEVSLPPLWRQKYMDVFGRMEYDGNDFEIKRKGFVTGISTDEGWIVIDKREQNKQRFGS